MAKNKRKEKYETEEVFESLDHTAQSAEGFLEKNAKILGIVFGAIVLIAVGYFAYLRFYVEPRNTEASNESAQADTYFKQDSMQLALNGSPGAFLGFNEIIDDFGGTQQANIAKYKAGVAKYELGDYQGALDLFKGFSTSEVALNVMKQGAIGDALVQLGKKEEGLDAYEKAINNSKLEVLNKIFTKKAAVLALDLKLNDRGLAVVNAFLEKFPDGDSDGEIAKFAETFQYATQK